MGTYPVRSMAQQREPPARLSIPPGRPAQARAERGNPPLHFRRYFDACRERGFRTCVHAGEEGPADYVREALSLPVDRIDHGNAAAEDPALLRILAERRIPLTMCPISNLRLKVVPDLAAHPLKRMLEQRLCVTVNSDDPAYFLGYASDNWAAVCRALRLTRAEILQLALNGVEASFLSDERKAALRQEVIAALPAPPDRDPARRGI